MHPKSRWNLVPALFGLSLGVCTTVGSQPAAPLPPNDAGKAQLEAVRSQVVAKLGLTPQQREALETRKQDHRTRMRDLLKQVRDTMKAMRDELQKPTIDRPRIDALQTELKAKSNLLADLRLEGILKIREILTPEQHKTMLEEFQKALPAPPEPVSDDRDPLLEDAGF